VGCAPVCEVISLEAPPEVTLVETIEVVTALCPVAVMLDSIDDTPLATLVAVRVASPEV